MTAALELENVSAGYRRKTVLHDLSFRVPPGEFAGLIGPNAAGKTTVLRCLTGLLAPDRGATRLFGHSLPHLDSRRRARLVGVVPQDLDTPMPFTVEQIVMMGRTAALSRWTPPSAADRHAVERAMAYTDVLDMRDRPFPQLSGGERKRAAIAMVLAQESRVVLLDEATSHLDINHRLEVMQIVDRLNREEKVTVLLVSHDLNLAAEYCRHLLLLDHGRLAAAGTPAEVLTDATLSRVYHCDVRVRPDPAGGAPTVGAAPRLVSASGGRGVRIFVIPGGGSGEELMRRLNLCDYSVSCGVLNRLDTDAEVADALGLGLTAEKPFSPISRPALDQAAADIATAHAVVVCAVPFGPGNLGNLALAERALDARKPVWIAAGVEGRDYTPSRAATARVRALLARGARSWSTIAELLAALPRAADQQPPPPDPTTRS